jgi:TspO/MBR family
MKIPLKHQVLVAATTLVTILINILADAIPLNAQTTAEISNRFDVYFVPAGFTFAIWGIIYLGLIAYAYYQARPRQAGNSRLKNISGLFVYSCVANAAWLFFWHFNLYALSLVAMLSLLVLLILIHLRLHPDKTGSQGIEKWVLDIPFKIYLGWICVATIANVTDVLSFYHWDGMGIEPILWAQIMLTVGVFLSIIFHLARKDLVVPLIFVWAYIGIGVKFKEIQQLSGSAWVLAILIAFIIFALDLSKKIKAGSEIPPPQISGTDRS